MTSPTPPTTPSGPSIPSTAPPLSTPNAAPSTAPPLSTPIAAPSTATPPTSRRVPIDAPPLRVVSLYPDVMNVYADRGNLITVRHRAAEYGIALHEFDVSLGDPLPSEADLVLIGGAQDREQHRVAHELADRGNTLRDWAEHDTAMLTVCGGFQLFGRWYRDKNGIVLPGAALFDVTTVSPGAAPRGRSAGRSPHAARAVGDILIESTLPDVGPRAERDSELVEIVGFENHAGRTYLGPTARPFGHVRYGRGNNGDDGSEGAIYRQAIGTYLHGSVLPKNPRLLDHLLAAALTHRLGEPVTLPELPAPYADRAHDAAAAIARRRAPSRN